MRVELRSEARDDLEEGAWFYEKHSAGLGDYFLDCIDTGAVQFYGCFVLAMDAVCGAVAAGAGKVES